MAWPLSRNEMAIPSSITKRILQNDPLYQCLNGLQEINPLFQDDVDPERDFDCMKESDEVAVCDVSSFSEPAAINCESRGTTYVMSGFDVCDGGTTLYENGFVCLTDECDIDAFQEALRSGDEESEDYNDDESDDDNAEDCTSDFLIQILVNRPSDGDYYVKSKKSKSKKGKYSSKAPKSYSKSLKSEKKSKDHHSKSEKSAKDYSSKSDKSTKDY